MVTSSCYIFLKDTEYVDKVKDVIKRVVAQYAVVNDDENFYVNASKETLQDFYDHSSPDTLQTTNLKINHQSFLDVLLLEIRRETLVYSAFKKRERQSRELLLLHEREVLESNIAAVEDYEAFEEDNDNLQMKKNIYLAYVSIPFLFSQE